MKTAEERIAELEEALAPFAAAYARLRYYGEEPHDDVPLFAGDQTMFELLNGEEGGQVTVGTLRAAHDAVGPPSEGT